MVVKRFKVSEINGVRIMSFPLPSHAVQRQRIHGFPSHKSYIQMFIAMW